MQSEKVRGLLSAFPALQLSEDRQMIYWAFPSLSFTIGNQPEKKKVQILKRCVAVLGGDGGEFLRTIKVKKENSLTAGTLI